MHRSTLKGLHEVVISDWRHGEFVISQALLRRATSPTNANSQSSRLQCVINLRIVDDKSNGEVNDQANDGVLIIVDLAGAEREKRTGNQGVRLLESNFINKTSMVFCLCLRSLLEHQKNPMKPLEKHFQDSLLTKYLRDYMEGKKRMALILTVKAGREDYHNTSCLLKQASPYMEIKFNNEPSKRRLSPSFVLKGYKEKLEPLPCIKLVPEHRLADDQVAEHEIQHLRESNLELEKELKDLKSLIEVQRLADDQVAEHEIQHLRESNLELEKELKDLKSLIEVHRLDDDQVAQEIQRLRESNLELEKELKYLKSLIEVQRLADDQVAEETQRLKESNLELEKEVKDLKSLIDVQISGDDQWDDSVVEDLPSPNKNAISPSKEDKDRLARRRKGKKCNQDIFGERTQVDLKDKWRNLIRRNTHH
ncbi:hypothetical protein L3X38_045506 [Prunus dulcis]|uniref:Kinesin-like protein n=1 Tax=Prunus dulcis TaxID=3755 RepID=A0AAD4UPD6_PRUDU|nr:hypothetical protein L3X38_045506 [Prunus dulcis]